MLDFWFTEHHTDNYKVSWRMDKILHFEKSPFQEIAVVESPELGRALLLDNIVQTTTKFEFIYHETIVHIPLMIHPEPKRVMVVGGGDGGAVKEILKHPSVETVDLIEIDERVIEVSKKWLPEISHALRSDKVNIMTIDGLKHMKQCSSQYDIIIVDCTDPSGPSMDLFSKDFYRDVYNALKDDGVFVSQTGSPSFSTHFKQAVQNIMEVFPLAKPYLTCEPTYIAGFWSFTVGSKKYQLDNINPERMFNIETKYYTPDIHKAAFVLPKYIEQLLK
ncbi:spermidine synthase [Desulforamulus reducens MI-1]|uniref:Polyamine aminopropyltransferase n=1 Tax=Desulforamulus reducens (strain ATCC BAA-1160 / DSM 100696 / MI-1) TaxID=349161 RepID=A4J8N0_DESRM|nr:polyamine aminopropyltransferase [Desulforamulus reducens]ABO51433.1 spermidine synthase [Desulforamulus reducens MI-1]